MSLANILIKHLIKQHIVTAAFFAHLFCCRLTGAIHETGHALYEQGRNLDKEWEGLPVNSALSMGIHESQSLFWERMVRADRHKFNTLCHWSRGHHQANQGSLCVFQASHVHASAFGSKLC